MNSLVTLSKENEMGIEIHFAIGYVETFNNKGNMQVRVYRILNQDVYNAVTLDMGDNKSFKFVKVKPTISKDNLGGQDNE